MAERLESFPSQALAFEQKRREKKVLISALLLELGQEQLQQGRARVHTEKLASGRKGREVVLFANRPKHLPIEIKDLYAAGKTLKEIRQYLQAQNISVATTTIGNKLRALEVELRSPTSRREDITDELLKRLYLEQAMSVEEIAAHFEDGGKPFTTVSIRNRLNGMGIRLSGPDKTINTIKSGELVVRIPHDNVLRQLFKKSVSKVKINALASEYGITSHALENRLYTLGILKRRKTLPRITEQQYSEARTMYLNGKSVDSVAAKLKFAPEGLRRRLEAEGLLRKRRTSK